MITKPECFELKNIDGIIRTDVSDQMYRLRWEVLDYRLGLPQDAAKDEWDELKTTIQAVVMFGDEVVGTGRAQLDKAGVYKIRRMATADSRRRQGIGTAILAFLEQESRNAGAQKLTLDARPAAVNIYLRAGFKPTGRIVNPRGLSLKTMEKDL